MADRAYTNVGLRTFLLAMEEVLGEKGVTAMLNIGFIEEAGQWAVNAPVEVIEIACRALGDATCSYRVRLEG
jgi:hypothetical protein